MVILPAIDLYNGNCVRLYQGDYSTSSKVAEDALQAALAFKESGAEWLHLVDLNGAKGEAGVNAKIIENLIKDSGLFVEIGGGIRDFEAAKRYIGMGAKRVILGSAAVKEPALVQRCVNELSPDAVAVGIDAKDGLVSTDGWLKGSGIHFIELAKRMEEMGVRYIIFTDISRDGTLSGPNLEMLKELSQSVKCDIIASGGIRNIDDISALKGLGLYGAICGKSIYSGTLDLKQAISVANSGKHMRAKRIIPCLDIKGGRVVKGVKFVDIRDAGDPVECAAEYQRQGADELAMLDISATVEGRKTMAGVVEAVAKSITIPLTVGGGISTCEDIERILGCGASKVSIGSAAVTDKTLIREAAKKFGSSRVVAAVDVKRSGKGNYTIIIHGGRTDTSIDALEWMKWAEGEGAGEVLLTSMDADGTKEGYDLEITKKAAENLNMPVIASGGCGRLEHFYDVFAQTKADAALAASLFHFGELTVGKVKDYLREKGIPVYGNK